MALIPKDNRLKRIWSAATGKPPKIIPEEKAGATGTVNFAGHITEEDVNPELEGADGLDRYDNMIQTDGQVAMTVRVLNLPIESAQFKIEPYSDGSVKSNGTKNNDINIQVAEWLEDQLLDNRRFDFQEFLTEILWHRYLGFSCNFIWREVNPETGKIELFGLPHRKQQTILDSSQPWEVENDQLTGIRQLAVRDGIMNEVFIPRENLCLLHHQKRGNNWQGLSCLRPAYPYSFINEKVLRWEAIAIEQSGVGWIKATVQEESRLGQGGNLSTKVINKIEDILKRHRATDYPYLIETDGIEFSKMDMKAQTLKDGTKLMEYCNRMISGVALAQHTMLGTAGNPGNRSLGDNFKDTFQTSQERDGKYIQNSVNGQICDPLIAMNWNNLEGFPRLSITGISKRNWTEWTKMLTQAAGIMNADTKWEFQNQLRVGRT